MDLMDTVDKKLTLVANRSAKVCWHGHRGLEVLDDMVSSLPTGQVCFTCKHTHTEGAEMGQIILQVLFQIVSALAS